VHALTSAGSATGGGQAFRALIAPADLAYHRKVPKLAHALVLATLVMAPTGEQPLAPGNHTFTLRHGGRARSYIVHVPAAAASGRALPVVLAFHGGGGEAAGFQAYAGLDAVADREGFLVVYPNGSGVFPRRLLTWNAGECCGYAMNNKIDDVGFAISVLDDLAKRTPTDSARIYATGHSNGAMMSHRLAAERADRIAAIVPVAGSLVIGTFAPSKPVAVLQIHSIDDPRALYAGGQGPPFPGTNVRSSHRPVPQTLDRWRRNNRCGDSTRVTDTKAESTSSGAKQGASRIEWTGCAPGAPVSHWKLTGVGHGWPGNAKAELREGIIGPPTTVISAAEEVWRFVSGVRR
jgi:polyhydroxybutyrate depolymerase